jgi:hypothetical protein
VCAGQKTKCHNDFQSRRGEANFVERFKFLVFISNSGFWHPTRFHSSNNLDFGRYSIERDVFN